MIRVGTIKDARRLAVWILDRVFRSDSYADILLDSCFKKHPLPPKDRSLTTELTYGTLRWWKKLNWILERTYRGNWNQVPDSIQRICEVALYQILFLEKVPVYAAVDEAVQIASETQGGKWKSMVNAVLRTVLRNPESALVPANPKHPTLAVSIEWSHPLWLVEKWTNQFGLGRAVAICRANNERPKIGIRINRLRSDRETVQQELESHGIQTETSPYLEEFLYVRKTKALTGLEGFQKGHFSVQDTSAGLVGHLTDPRPREIILDLAAAPGGKATHLAELSGGKATIVALDIHESRIQLLSDNLKRLGLDSILQVVGDGRIAFRPAFDTVLVDAPCSGLGVLQRRPELKWRRKPEDIPKLVEIQQDLLESGAKAVKSGGTLIYSTCTVMNEENQGVVSGFLNNSHPEFKIEHANAYVHPDLVSESGFVETWPDVHGMDGSFAVRMKKTR
jgi:16S rRNA (cytosine967-C5)-methyltransferase